MNNQTCFVSDTLIHIRLSEITYPIMMPHITPDPVRPVKIGAPLLCEIQYLRPGIEVLSRCEFTGEIAYRKVEKHFESISDGDLFDLDYHSDSLNGWRGMISVTGKHQFWVRERGWVDARDLNPKDAFLTFDGNPATLISKNKIDYDCPVYALSISEFHTYFVTADGIWVRDKIHPQ